MKMFKFIWLLWLTDGNRMMAIFGSDEGDTSYLHDIAVSSDKVAIMIVYLRNAFGKQWRWCS